MFHARFHGHRAISSVGEDFLKVFSIYWHGDQLGHKRSTIYVNCLPDPLPKEAPYEIANVACQVSRS